MCELHRCGRAVLDGGVGLCVVSAVGYVQFTYQGSIGYCVQDQNAPPGGVYVPPAAPPVGAAGASAGGGHIKWWIALIIGLAGGGLLLGGVAAFLIWYGMRWKHSKEAAAFQLASKTVRCSRSWSSAVLHSMLRQGGGRWRVLVRLTQHAPLGWLL